MNRYKRNHEQWVNAVKNNISGANPNFKGVTITKSELIGLTKKCATATEDVHNILVASYNQAGKELPLGRQLVKTNNLQSS
jgi:hypothetical protein